MLIDGANFDEVEVEEVLSLVVVVEFVQQVCMS